MIIEFSEKEIKRILDECKKVQSILRIEQILKSTYTYKYFHKKFYARNYVYSYLDTDFNTKFYIGSGTNDRIIVHIIEALYLLSNFKLFRNHRNKHMKVLYLLRLLQLEKFPKFKIECISDRNMCYYIEKKLIEFYDKKENIITNIQYVHNKCTY